jgi:hypothetical protein
MLLAHSEQVSHVIPEYWAGFFSGMLVTSVILLAVALWEHNNGKG